MNNNYGTLFILSPGFPASEADSNCLPSQQLFIRELNRNFPSLKIIVLAFQYPFLKSEYKWNGNHVIAFAGMHKGKMNRALLWLRIWTELTKLKKENNVIGLLSFWCGECALIGNRFARKNKIKNYCWISGQDAKRENKYVKWIRPNPESLISMSDFLADEFCKNHKVLPHQIVPNGIDKRAFIDKEFKKNIDVSGAGSFIALKKYDILFP